MGWGLLARKNTELFDELNEYQKERIKLDERKNKYLKDCGYKVVRVWGSDIRKRPEYVRSKLEDLDVLEHGERI